LHEELLADLKPIGRLEDDIVRTITRLLWRKNNLSTLRMAELALEHESRIQVQKFPPRLNELLEREVSAAERREIAMEAAEDQARKELGERYALVEIGETATVDRLLQDLAVEERLDAMIDKCLKRLMHLRAQEFVTSLTAAATRPSDAAHSGPKVS
jgi:hypothetical protein